ncbi:transcription factor 15-like [Oppia nitens]|uniref:transcription factor 15-like n=1 Tax=Oppia nitens TaxID=1686743 RepID=UPI0023D9CF46|nr:transcription factor 15-like [Oppia nitens]
MDDKVVAKDDDSCEQQIEYTFLTPLTSTVNDHDLLVHQQNSYHLYYTDSVAALPTNLISDEDDGDENFESCESNGSTHSGSEVRNDPFSPHCKIPLPGDYGNSHFFDTTTFIRRRNERERARVRSVNDGFERLRQHLPLSPTLKDKRLSKVETLRFAITYINHLQSVLNSKSQTTNGNK